jgi:hypothetical protein
MLHKLFGGSRHRVSPTTDARHLAVNVLGFAGHLPAKILNQKLARVLQRMIEIGALQLPQGRSSVRDLFAKKAKGCYAVSLVPGKYFTTPAMTLQSRKPVPAESPLYDPLRAIGFQDAEIARILRSFPNGKVQVWSDVTLRAMEGARGFPGFKKDPKAYLLYHLKQARDNKLTPPDWWHAARREEERRQSEFSRRSNEPLGDDQAAAYWQAREAALGEFIRDHQQDFDRLLQMFATVARANHAPRRCPLRGSPGCPEAHRGEIPLSGPEPVGSREFRGARLVRRQTIVCGSPWWNRRYLFQRPCGGGRVTLRWNRRYLFRAIRGGRLAWAGRLSSGRRSGKEETKSKHIESKESGLRPRAF